MDFVEFVKSNTLDLKPSPPLTPEQLAAQFLYHKPVWFVSEAMLRFLREEGPL